MTSDLTNDMSALTFEADQVRLSTPASSRRCYKTGHHQRHHLHTKRAATIDPETNEEKLRIVVLGATRVGEIGLFMCVPTHGICS